MADGNPWRDNGPYETADQARAQYEAATHGIPVGAAPLDLPLGEVLAITGVEVTEYERDRLMYLGHALDPETIQVIAGWVIRAHLGQAHPAVAKVRTGRRAVVQGEEFPVPPGGGRLWAVPEGVTVTEVHPDEDADPFRCICDPTDIFDPPDPTPTAVEGCPAHRARRIAQQWPGRRP